MGNSIIGVFVLATAISMFIAGCAQQVEAPEEFQEVIDTGILAVESAPSEAQVYVDGEIKGQTPLTLYNFPIGAYNVAVKKEGYSDFEKTVSVKVGLTEKVDAELAPLKSEAAETKPEEFQKDLPTAQSNKINLSSFAMYYDFDNKLFTNLRSEGSDVYSRKYSAYVDFAALSPAKMKILPVPLKEITKAECIDAGKGVAQLYSGQTLCVITAEGNYFTVSGSWDKMPDELEFVQLN